MTGEKNRATCTFCGQPIGGEPHEQPNPCEYCSSPSGGYPHLVILTEAIAGSVVGYVEGATYPQILLSIAKFLLDKKDDKLCGLATIMSHLACEVAIERSLSDVFQRKGIQSLEETVADVLNGYNLGNDKVWNLYSTLTGDPIREQPFWEGFLRSAKRRDNIIRKGLIVGRADAEESIKVSSDFLAHLPE
ncbi:MAG TPA: hypothetical protein VLB08_03345 [Candidatus Deferrimicrobium sp.]|nr:hypothetical protein [Candidatus Deferrimicrobium sp.]